MLYTWNLHNVVQLYLNKRKNLYENLQKVMN